MGNPSASSTRLGLEQLLSLIIAVIVVGGGLFLVIWGIIKVAMPDAVTTREFDQFRKEFRSDMVEIKRVLGRVSYIEGKLGIRVPTELSSTTIASPGGGYYSFSFPGDRSVTFNAPAGWVRAISTVTVTPFSVTSQELLRIMPTYIRTTWSFGFSSSLPLTECIDLSSKYTAEDLEAAGVKGPETLTLLKLEKPNGEWQDLKAELDGGTSILRAKVCTTGDFVLAAKP